MQNGQQQQLNDSNTSSSSSAASNCSTTSASARQQQQQPPQQILPPQNNNNNFFYNSSLPLQNSSASSVCATPAAANIDLQQQLFLLQQQQQILLGQQQQHGAHQNLLNYSTQNLQQNLPQNFPQNLPQNFQQNLQQNFTQQNFPQQQQTTQHSSPLSIASLNYGPFGLPSFSLTPQGHSLVHFPQQLQQQQELEKQAAMVAAVTAAAANPQAAAAALQQQQEIGAALNAGLVATQNAYEGLPIFMVPQAGALTLNALQRAAEFKAMAINALLQQQQQQLQQTKPDTSKHFHVFVGDLSQDVDNKVLLDAFKKFGEVSDAKVMRDPQSAKSRSFGFVAFPSKEDAQRAIEGMNGALVGRRAIRTGWAVRRGQLLKKEAANGGAGSDDELANSSATFESVYNATEADNTTIYIGGLSSAATEEPIRLAFSEFGSAVQEIRLFAAQNFGFVVFGEKAAAARAILAMNGKELDLGIVGGKCRLRVKWGKPAVQQQKQQNSLTSSSSMSTSFLGVGRTKLKSGVINTNPMGAAMLGSLRAAEPDFSSSSSSMLLALQQQQQQLIAAAFLQAQQQQSQQIQAQQSLLSSSQHLPPPPPPQTAAIPTAANGWPQIQQF